MRTPTSISRSTPAAVARTLSDAAEVYRRWSLMAPDREHADRAITSLTNHLEQTRLTVQNRLTTNASTT